MRSAPPNPRGRAQLDQLRAKIRAIEPESLAVSGRVGVRAKSGKASAAERLNLPSGLHEICPADYLDTPSALAVQTGFMVQQLRASGRKPPLVWVRVSGGQAQDFGAPYPLGLMQWGLPPDRVLLAETGDTLEALWAMEEALRAGAWLIGEVGKAAHYDLTRSKRLNLAARERDGLALLLRAHDAVGPSAALTRWRISARPSPGQAWRGATGLPGLGHPRFRAQLERARGGPPAHFDIEWKHETFHVLEPAPMAHARPDPVRTQNRRRA